MNLVSCRNLLIYMDQVLQKKIMPLFHYTLVPDGTLFSGSSESIGEFSDLFSPIDTKWKIFERKGIVVGEDGPHLHIQYHDTPNGYYKEGKNQTSRLRM